MAEPTPTASSSTPVPPTDPVPPPNPLDSLTPPELRKKLDQSKKDLRNYLEKKKKVDRELATLEASIHAFEGSYLSDALLPATTAVGNTNAQFGNIIKGYDSYLKAAATGADRKRGRGNEEPRDSDRMFSRSSATFQKALDLRSTEVVESASEDESMGSSAPGKKKRKDR